MRDEIVLPLCLASEPGNLRLRRVYADWLEEQDDSALARYYRLDAESKLAGREGDQHRLRAELNSLCAAHAERWVKWSGLVLNWDTLLEVIRHRLTETAAWCTQRLPTEWRSHELLPAECRSLHGLMRHSYRPVCWEKAVHEIGNLREKALLPEHRETIQQIDPFTQGRLLFCSLERGLKRADVSLLTANFVDRRQTPPWDTWAVFLDDGPAGNTRAQRHWEREWIIRRPVLPVAFPSYLLAWIPETQASLVTDTMAFMDHHVMAWAEDAECELASRLARLGWKPPAQQRPKELWRLQHAKRLR